MNNIVFSSKGWADYCYWQNKEHIKTLVKIRRLLEDIRRCGPMDGSGKPEPLRHCEGWSRRIDETNRLVYRVRGDAIEIVSCRGHYN